MGGEIRGNYATLNPLDKNAGLSPTNGNLDVVGVSGTTHRMIRGTIGVSSGKWYWEITAVSTAGSPFVGIAKQSASLADGQAVGSDAFGWGYSQYIGQKYTNGTLSSYGAGWTSGDIIGIAFDVDNGTITFYKNGTTQGVAFTGLTSGPYFPAVSVYHPDQLVANFGQRAFAYPLSGFKALCDTNIPEGTITTSGTYTGNGVADGPVVYLNGIPTAMTIGVNAVTFGTHADKLSNGFKLRTTNVLYNQNALSYSYSITTTGAKFKFARAQPNP